MSSFSFYAEIFFQLKMHLRKFINEKIHEVGITESKIVFHSQVIEFRKKIHHKTCHNNIKK